MFITSYRKQKIIYLIMAIIILLLIINVNNTSIISFIFFKITIKINIVGALLLGLLEFAIIVRLFDIRNK